MSKSQPEIEQLTPETANCSVIELTNDRSTSESSSRVVSALKNSLSSIVSGIVLKPPASLSSKTGPLNLLSSSSHSIRRFESAGASITRLNQSLIDIAGIDRSLDRDNNLSLVSSATKRLSPSRKQRVKSSEAKTRSSTNKAALFGQSPFKYVDRTRMVQGVVQKVEERKKISEITKKISEQACNTKNRRKDIEKQVEALEIRINRLRQEDEVMMKKVIKTAEKTEQALLNKKRRNEDLQTKHYQNMQKEEEMKRLQQKINNDRTATTSNLRQSLENNHKSKKNIALNVKLDNYSQKLVKENIVKSQSDKNRAVINKITEQHQAVKTKKLDKEINSMTNLGRKCLRQINNDTQVTDDLANRYNELVEYEQRMLEKLGQTFNLHKSKVEELEKLYSSKPIRTEANEKTLTTQGQTIQTQE